MPPVRQVSLRQLEMLVEFAESNNNVGIYGPLGHQAANKGWADIARKLNSLGEGTIKSPIKWRRYWHLLKCRARAKAADVRRSQFGAREGPKRMAPLTDLEQRIVSGVGDVAVSGVGDVAVPDAGDVAKPLQVFLLKPDPDAPPEPQRPRVRSTMFPTRSPRHIPLPNGGDNNVPQWLSALEERRIAAEERLADAAVSLASTNRGILKSLQQMADTQAQLVSLLQNRFEPPKEPQ